MARRWILGKRSDNTRGVFIGPPGVDPDTASASQLTLHIANNIDQILMQGQVSSLPSTVTLGVTSFAPYVLLLAFGSFSGQLAGLARPYGHYWDSRNAQVQVNAANMTISGSSPHAYYIVFNRAAP